VGQAGLGQVAQPLVGPYGGDPLGLWGETSPQELLDWWLRIAAEPQPWRQRGQQGAQAMEAMSWRRSMAQLLALLEM